MNTAPGLATETESLVYDLASGELLNANTAEVITAGDGEHMLIAALAWARAGWPVFPCRRDKTPHTARGFKDATRDETQIRLWWTAPLMRGAAIGSPCGPRSLGGNGHDLFDIEGPAKTVSGLSALDQLQQAGVVEGWTRAHRTPSGGFHLAYPASGRGTTQLARHGIEVRAAGSYVLLPPSTAGSKGYEGRYEVVVDRTGRADLTPTPLDWSAVRDLLEPATRRRAVLRGADRPTEATIAHRLAGARAKLAEENEGNRNNLLFWVAMRHLEAGVEDLEEVVEAALAGGLTPTETHQTIASARRRASTTEEHTE